MYLMGFSCPFASNIACKEARFVILNTALWHVKGEIIPIVIGALGAVSPIGLLTG